MLQLFHKNHGNWNIAMWNIHGFPSTKAIDDNFLKTIANVDILSLVETWAVLTTPKLVYLVSILYQIVLERSIRKPEDFWWFFCIC